MTGFAEAQAAFLAFPREAAPVLTPDQLATRLGVTQVELAAAAGLSRDAVSKTARRNSPATQARLRVLLGILNRVTPWAGSPLMAFAWYRSQPLPEFGDLTAEDLVKQGRAEAVQGYLSRIAEGGYA
jgi:transcriptional regulator with XRE-family HTH domain